MRVAIDTNVRAYAEGVGDAAPCRVATGLVERLPDPAVLLPAQVLGELMLVLTRKAGRTREAARDAVLGRDVVRRRRLDVGFVSGGVRSLGEPGVSDVGHARDGGRCRTSRRIVLSDDLQHGFTWRGVTLVNPCLPDESPLLAAILSQDA